MFLFDALIRNMDNYTFLRHVCMFNNIFNNFKYVQIKQFIILITLKLLMIFF